MQRSLWFQITIAVFALAQMASAATTYYVATNACGTGDGLSWANATNDLQGAIDAIAAGANSTVWVSNGVYQTGGRTNYPAGSTLTNRIVIWKQVTVRSASDNPADTIIKGAWASDGNTNGVDAVRCVFMTTSSFLIGFTLTNGATSATDVLPATGRGGGLYSGTASNCIISGCSASAMGGGAVFSKLYDCTLTGNSVELLGGGAHECTLYNCKVINNRALSTSGGFGGGVSGGQLLFEVYNSLLVGNWAGRAGGGTYSCSTYNCTIVSNSAREFAGGISGSKKAYYNSIIYNNVAPTGPNWWAKTDWNQAIDFTNSCTTPAKSGWASGNITNNPAFVDVNTGDYHLRKNSLAINAGTNFSWMTASADPRRKDLDGFDRVDKFSGLSDMGCYEFIPDKSGTVIVLR